MLALNTHLLSALTPSLLFNLGREASYFRRGMSVTDQADTRRRADALMARLGVENRSSVLKITFDGGSYPALRYPSGGAGHLFLGDHQRMGFTIGEVVEELWSTESDPLFLRASIGATLGIAPHVAISADARRPFKVKKYGPVEHLYHFDKNGAVAIRSYVPNNDENFRLGAPADLSDASLDEAVRLLTGSGCAGITLLEKGGELFVHNKDTLAVLTARIQRYNLIAVREVLTG
jgi:hypothetical protein